MGDAGASEDCSRGFEPQALIQEFCRLRMLRFGDHFKFRADPANHRFKFALMQNNGLRRKPTFGRRSKFHPTTRAQMPPKFFTSSELAFVVNRAGRMRGG